MELNHLKEFVDGLSLWQLAGIFVLVGVGCGIVGVAAGYLIWGGNGAG